jgi:hypothetical protein
MANLSTKLANRPRGRCLILGKVVAMATTTGRRSSATIRTAATKRRSTAMRATTTRHGCSTRKVS